MTVGVQKLAGEKRLVCYGMSVEAWPHELSKGRG